MITFTKAYQSSDGQTWPTLELAQERELKMLLVSNGTHEEALISDILKHKVEVISILQTKGDRVRVRRKVNGAKRKPRLVAGEVL
jgi:hypothetical protein